MLHFAGMHVGCATCLADLLSAELFLLCVHTAMLSMFQDLLVHMILSQQLYKQLKYCRYVFTDELSAAHHQIQLLVTFLLQNLVPCVSRRLPGKTYRVLLFIGTVTCLL